jgi:hypothetical protein
MDTKSVARVLFSVLCGFSFGVHHSSSAQGGMNMGMGMARFKDVRAYAELLHNVRGTAFIDAVTRGSDGSITGFHLTATRGAGWQIGNEGNATVTSTDITPLAQIVIAPTTPAALTFEFAFDIVFDSHIKCESAASVTVSHENSAPLKSPAAIIFTHLLETKSVSDAGFTVKGFIVLYGATMASINTLLDGFLTANTSFNFVSQCTKEANI